MAVDLTPLNDCILLDPEPSPDYHHYKQYHHIVVPEKYEHGPEDRPIWGKVIGVGKECRLVHVGDRVVFGKWAPARIRFDEREYIIVREDDILAVDNGRS